MIKAQLKRTFTKPLPLFLLWLFGMYFLFDHTGAAMAANAVCKVEAKVCAWTDKIVGVKTPNMVASGFQISPDLIVTNRHVAEDHLRVLVRNAEGEVQSAVSLPHDFPADLVLLRLEDSQPDLNFKIELTQQKSEKLYWILWMTI